ncbi:hypothetical protein D3C73_1436140 [compost metagenome]
MIGLDQFFDHIVGGKQQQVQILLLIVGVVGEIDGQSNDRHGVPLFDLIPVTELLQVFEQLTLSVISLKCLDERKSADLPDVLADFFFQLRFGLEQMMHLFSDHLKFAHMS